jgi:hypothetical protein
MGMKEQTQCDGQGDKNKMQIITYVVAVGKGSGIFRSTET